MKYYIIATNKKGEELSKEEKVSQAEAIKFANAKWEAMSKEEKMNNNLRVWAVVEEGEEAPENFDFNEAITPEDFDFNESIIQSYSYHERIFEEYILMDWRDGSWYDKGFHSLEEAVKYADAEWAHLSEHDKKLRDSYYIIESINPDVDDIDHYDGDIVKRYK